MTDSGQIVDFNECICGNGSYKIYRNFGERKVIKCSVCGLLRSYPLPQKSICDDNYQSVNDVQKLHHHQLVVLKQVMKLAENTDEKILDIGCSTGNMLQYLREKGYSGICGIETNDYAVKICLNKKLPAKKMNVDDMSISDKFDIVYMNHVLEHVENLRGFLSQLKTILSEKAYVIIAVPNIGGRKTENPDWIGYQFEQHYWHFTPESLSGIFQQNGFSMHRLITLSGGKFKCAFYNLFNIKGDSLISVFKYEK